MRIIRGRFKTRYFKVPKSFPSRPTTDFAKEGLFNILENQLVLHDLAILDLCAGSGNISFEFLSREAGFVTSVDTHYGSIKHIKQTARDLDCTSEITAIKTDLLRFLEMTNDQFDIIFADPPYAYEKHTSIAHLVFERQLLKKNGLLIIEHGKQTNLSAITQFDFCRKYGSVNFSFFSNHD